MRGAIDKWKPANIKKAHTPGPLLINSRPGITQKAVPRRHEGIGIPQSNL